MDLDVKYIAFLRESVHGYVNTLNFIPSLIISTSTIPRK